MPASATRRFLLDGVLGPGLVILGCVYCLGHILPPGVDLESMTRGRFSAAAWPKFMLSAAIVCCLIQSLRCLWNWYRGPAGKVATVVEEAQPENRTALAPLAAMPVEDEDPKIAAAAGAIVVAYGVAFEQIGFVFSTVAFFMAWLLLGGFRKKLVPFVSVALLGTLFNIVLFVKVARMPLERGKGAFDAMTVAVYRALRIY